MKKPSPRWHAGSRWLATTAAALLAAGLAGHPAIGRAGAIQTTTTAQGFAGGKQDVHNLVPNADAEAFVERFVDPGTLRASALAQTDGNLEVGLALGPRTFYATKDDAFATIDLTQKYELGDARIGGIAFTVQPGEIRFVTELNQPFAGDFDGTLSIGVTASINAVEVSRYFFNLRVISTNGGININSGSNDMGLSHVSEVLHGDAWGVKTEGFSDVLVITPAIFPGDVVTVSYFMEARVNVDPVDARLLYSVRLGDPLDGLGGGMIAVTPVPVPEPGSGALMVCGLLAFGLFRRVRRGRP